MDTVASSQTFDPSLEEPGKKGKFMDSFMWMGDLDESPQAQVEWSNIILLRHVNGCCQIEANINMGTKLDSFA